MIKKQLINRAALLAVAGCLGATSVTAQMVGPDAYIKATGIEIGIRGAGGFEGVDTGVSPPLPGMHFRSDTQYFGFVANPQNDGWATFDGDFFTPGSPENGWGFEIGTSGVSHGNNCSFLQEINGSITNWSHVFDCYSADWEGDYTSGTNLHFKINYFAQETDLYYTTTVSITNNTGATIPDMYYYRNLDPDNNVTLSFDYTTQNTIVSEPTAGCGLAHVSGTQSTPWNSYLGLAGIGNNFRVSYGGFANRDASDLWYGTGFTQTVGSTIFADEAIALAYRIQNLAPGATETFKFVVILDNASASNAINNLVYLAYLGSLTAPPAICTNFVDTVRTCGDSVPINIQGSIVNDFTWVWSPTNGLSDSVGSSVMAFPDTTTTYSVTGTPVSGCLNPVTMSIVMEVTPADGNSPVISTPPPLCINDPVFTFTADTLGGTWIGAGITSASGGTFNPATAGVGSYIITYVTPGTCNAIDTTIVNVTGIPDATITQPPLQCISAAPFNLVSAGTGGTWSGPGITDAVNGTFNPGTAGAGAHVITYTIAGICNATDTVTINVVTAYDVTIAPHASVCDGSPPFVFTAATAGGTWSGTGIVGPASGTFSPSTAGAGTHVITYTLAGSCGNTDTVHITVLPQPDATITPVAPVCLNSPAFNLTAASPGGTWTGFGITSASAGTFNPNTVGPHTITYSIGGTCPDVATTTINVAAIPTPNFVSNLNNGCDSLCVHFSESVSTSCSTVLYDFGDASTSSSLSPTHCYQAPGVYSVTITCTDANNCTGTTTIPNMITIVASPTANFSISPSSTVPPNTIVTFTDISANGGNSFWTFGDPSSLNNTSNLTTASHTYDNEGDFCISLYSTNNGGCMDSVKYCIIVIGEATIYIPNVFTPNNDGVNDRFFITTKNVADLECEIYDRWGLKIAEFSGINGGWNGQTKSGDAPDGVYFYTMHATGNDGKKMDQSGYIQLIRSK